MLLDFHGCGHEVRETPLTLEEKLDDQLQLVWGSRAKSIVIAPEVDIWLWGTDSALHEALHWSAAESIRDWLRHRGFRFNADGKPLQPKEAMEVICREQKRPRSSAIYERITRRVSLQHCTDQTFQRLRAQLLGWFAP